MMTINRRNERRAQRCNTFPQWKVCFGALCTLLFLFGCQRAENETRVITEEMSQPENGSSETSSEVVETNQADPSSEPSVPEAADPVAQAKTPDETPLVSESKPAEASEQNPETVPQTVPTAESSSQAKMKPAETLSSKRVQGFINVEEEIARQKRMDKLGLGQDAKTLEPREPKLLVTEREFIKERDADAWRVSYNDLDLLKILNMEPVPLDALDYLPGWLTQLEGKRVILRGWMFPPIRSEKMKGFIFVRDNQVCCFGPNAKAYDKLTVRLKPGTTVGYIQGRPFDVIGTFKLDPWIEDERDLKTGEFIEKLGMLYHLEDAVVLDKK